MYVYVLQSKERTTDEYSPVTTVLKAVKLVHVTNIPCLRMSKFTLSSLIILSKDSHGTITPLIQNIMIAPIDFLWPNTFIQLPPKKSIVLWCVLAAATWDDRGGIDVMPVVVSLPTGGLYYPRRYVVLSEFVWWPERLTTTRTELRSRSSIVSSNWQKRLLSIYHHRIGFRVHQSPNCSHTQEGIGTSSTRRQQLSAATPAKTWWITTPAKMTAWM